MAITTLVTLEEAKAHLRIDQDIMDADITLKLQAAEGLVRRHCEGTDFSDLADFDLSLIKAAILMLLGHLDRIRADEEVQPNDRFWMPPAVHQLLMPFRQPGVA